MDESAGVPRAEQPQGLLVEPNSSKHDLSNSVLLLPQWLVPELSPHWPPGGTVVTYPKEMERASPANATVFGQAAHRGQLVQGYSPSYTCEVCDCDRL